MTSQSVNLVVTDRVVLSWLQEITSRVVMPEVAFTGDTTAEFITDPANAEVPKATLWMKHCCSWYDFQCP